MECACTRSNKRVARIPVAGLVVRSSIILREHNYIICVSSTLKEICLGSWRYVFASRRRRRRRRWCHHHRIITLVSLVNHQLVEFQTSAEVWTQHTHIDRTKAKQMKKGRNIIWERARVPQIVALFIKFRGSQTQPRRLIGWRCVGTLDGGALCIYFAVYFFLFSVLYFFLARFVLLNMISFHSLTHSVSFSCEPLSARQSRLRELFWLFAYGLLWPCIYIILCS